LILEKLGYSNEQVVYKKIAKYLKNCKISEKLKNI
jgi:hypothetical protein